MGYDAIESHNSNDITPRVYTQHIASDDFTARVEDRPMDADAIIRRLRQVFDAKNDVALAAALNLAASAPSNWRQRNSPPLAICASVAESKGVSLDWLIFGVGVQRLGSPADGRPMPEGNAIEASETARRITRFVYFFDAMKSPEEMTWLEQHLKRSVHEYAEWLATPVAHE